jgi:queuine tRNA-ribosyltransferase
MEGLRGAIEEGQLDQFVTEFYAKRGMEVPDLDS